MNQQGINQDAIKRFAVIAERFYSLVDSAATLDRSDFLVQVYRLLPELIDEAIRLPEIHFNDGEDDDAGELPDDFVEKTMKQMWAKAELHHQEWEPRYRALGEKLGNWNLYWHVFDRTDDEDHEAIQGSLADDLAGIYCDLKDGIRLMESRQAAAEDIVFKWQYGFHIHWGRHAMNALRTIHVRLEDELTGLNSPD